MDDGDVYNIISNAIEVETKIPRDSFSERLEACLGAWQKLGICSFATAFEIEGNAIRLDKNNKPLIYNGLSNCDNNIYPLFIKLTDVPDSECGIWPWEIIRKKVSEQDKKEGLFPAELHSLKKISLPEPLWGDENALDVAINNDFSANNEEEEKLSWKWYAYYPALLGDLCRNDNKESKQLIYIYGTRKEFLRRTGGRDRDFGLIVGLTTDDDNKAKLLKNAILAAWNILVVAEHIIEDADHIGALEAAKAMSHTFRTYVESYTQPAVRAILSNGNPCEGEKLNGVLAQLREVSLLAGFMGFVARGGIKTGLLRKDIDIEPEEYDVAGFIFEQFSAAVSDELSEPKIRFIDDIEEPVEVKDRFCRKFYLKSICAELIKNIRDHGVDDGNGIPLSIRITRQENTLKIVLKNLKQNNDECHHEGSSVPGEGLYFSDLLEDPIRGLKSLTSMIDACGGELLSYNDKIDESDYWVSTLKFDLEAWKRAVESDGTNTNVASHKQEISNNDFVNMGECNKQDSPSEFALRVLLLDDQLADPRKALHSLRNIGGEWVCYQRNIKGHKFTCLFQKSWKLEIVLCRSLLLCRDYLLDEKFDICLVDVDFREDSERGRYQVPSLGGILPALALARNEYTLVTIFTAMDADLRSDANYGYLRELSQQGRLGTLEIEILDGTRHMTKELSEQLPRAFGRWAANILPRRKIRAGDAMLLAKTLSKNQWPSGNEGFNGSTLGIRKGEEWIEVPSIVFDPLDNNDGNGGLLPDDRNLRKKVAFALGGALCGHAMVATFYRAYHGMVCRKLENIAEELESMKAWFGYDKQCSLTDKIKEECKKQDGNDNDNVKKIFRVKISCFGEVSGKCYYFYGIWCGKRIKKLKECLKDILIKNNSSTVNGNNAITVTPHLFDYKGEQATDASTTQFMILDITGNRDDDQWKSQALQGGSLNDLFTKGKLDTLCPRVELVRKNEQKTLLDNNKEIWPNFDGLDNSMDKLTLRLYLPQPVGEVFND